MTLTNYLRSGVAALAIAAIVPAVAQTTISPSTAHPLLTPAIGNKYTYALSAEVAKIANDDAARLRAGGFIVELEKVLKEKRNKATPVIYPKDAVVGQLSLVAIVPPTGMETTPIGVCLQQGVKTPGKDDVVHTNIGTLQIMSDGKVVSQAWNGVKTGGEVNGKFQAACIPYFKDYVAFINKEAGRMAASPDVPAPPPAPAAATVAALRP